MNSDNVSKHAAAVEYRTSPIESFPLSANRADCVYITGNLLISTNAAILMHNFLCVIRLCVTEFSIMPVRRLICVPLSFAPPDNRMRSMYRRVARRLLS